MLNDDLLKTLTNNYTDLKTLAWILICAIAVNILVIIFKFILDIKLKEREKNIHRKNLLISNTIKVQEKLYQDLDKLTVLGYDEKIIMLHTVNEIQEYIMKNKLYLEKDILQTTNKILNYFRTLITYYGNKDVKKETLLLEEYVKRFNK